MGEWAYWQKVVIVVLTIVLVVVAYKKLLRWVGGNSRFDDHFAFLQPIERVSAEMMIVRFELPQNDTITLIFLDEQSSAEIVVLNEMKLKSGTHEFEVNTSEWPEVVYTCILKSGNQRIERILSSEKNKV
jgi:hypothetical protein